MDNREISPARRRVLKAVGGMVIGFYLPTAGAAKRVVPVAISLKPNAFVRIDVDDTVTVTVKHSEMGQGPLTGLTTLVAEELDADWSQMRAVQAPANTKLYNNLEFGPMQGTGASSAMANSYEQMRKAGATARAALVQAAARRWRVPAAEISIQRGVVRHLASARHCSFGALVAEASALPISGTVRLKPASAFTLIGRTDPVPRLDVPGKVNGTTLYTMDIHAPGMLTVVVARAPRFGGRLKSFDGAAARAVEGVVAVKAIRSGVAVYALNTWAALSARALLRTEWDDTAAEMRGSVELFARLHQLAAAPGLLAASSGDAQAALAGADHVHEAQFSFPYLAHAPMEPLDGYIEWDGKRVKARFGSQIQTLDQMQIAKLMDIPIEQVELETLLSGGSFGRRIDMGNDVVAQMVEAAQAIGPNRPLKVVWTREDDIRGGFYRPIVYHRLRGAIRDGHIVAWSDTIAAQSFTFGTAMEGGYVHHGVDQLMVEGAVENPYGIGNFRCDVHVEKVGVTTTSMRAVAYNHTIYATECFVDQLLVAARQDPVAGRLAMLDRSAPRMANVLRVAARKAQWGVARRAPGHALGVAVSSAFNTFVAEIAEVSVGEGGEPRVHRVWCVVDCGIAVNPDIVRAQMEGAIGYGLSMFLYGGITLDRGVPQQHNFNDYRVLRMNEMPAVDVTIIASDQKPTGVGEAGLPTIGPAVANALARLGRQRPSVLPMVKPA